MNRKRIWLLCCLAVIVLAAFTYSPLVLSAGQILPKLGPMPFSLWWGFLIMGLLVGLTALGAYFHPVHENKEEEGL